MTATEDFTVVAVLFGVLGGSGIVGWIFSYLQFRQRGTEERRKHLRETALTPAFRKWLGTTTIVVGLVEEIGKAPKDNLRQLGGLVQALNDLHWEDIENDPEFFSSLYFLPQYLQTEIFDLMNPAQDFVHSCALSLVERKVVPSVPPDLASKLDRLSRDLKKELGIE